MSRNRQESRGGAGKGLGTTANGGYAALIEMPLQCAWSLCMWPGVDQRFYVLLSLCGHDRVRAQGAGESEMRSSTGRPPGVCTGWPARFVRPAKPRSTPAPAPKTRSFGCTSLPAPQPRRLRRDEHRAGSRAQASCLRETLLRPGPALPRPRTRGAIVTCLWRVVADRGRPGRTG